MVRVSAFHADDAGSIPVTRLIKNRLLDSSCGRFLFVNRPFVSIDRFHIIILAQVL